jgi:hypothetical protein
LSVGVQVVVVRVLEVLQIYTLVVVVLEATTQ